MFGLTARHFKRVNGPGIDEDYRLDDGVWTPLQAPGIVRWLVGGEVYVDQIPETPELRDAPTASF